LWSGEEQDCSLAAYVKHTSAQAEDPKPEFAKCGGYFNLTPARSAARAGVFGRLNCGQSATALAPFEDLGFYACAASASRGLVERQHVIQSSWLPASARSYDPIEYSNITWHTNNTLTNGLSEDMPRRLPS
jgi:hypothetical protein